MSRFSHHDCLSWITHCRDLFIQSLKKITIMWVVQQLSNRRGCLISFRQNNYSSCLLSLFGIVHMTTNLFLYKRNYIDDSKIKTCSHESTWLTTSATRKLKSGPLTIGTSRCHLTRRLTRKSSRYPLLDTFWRIASTCGWKQKLRFLSIFQEFSW